MGPATTNVTVPTNLNGQSLDTVEQLLTQKGLSYKVKSAGIDPNQAANIVTRTDPKSGTSVTVGTTITLYVVNYTNGSPAATPSPNPTVNPSPSPTPKPSPSPSPTKTTTPTPNPTPTATPKPGLTPTVGVPPGP